MQGQHNQETHGNRVHAPSRTLLTGGRPRRRKAAAANRASTSSPAKAAQSRLRDKTAAASPRRPDPAVVSSPSRPESEEVDVPLQDMDDNALATAYTEALTADDDDRVALIERELDRRDQADEGEVDPWASQDYMDRLAEPDRKKPLSQREQAKEAYREWVYATVLRAESETGNLWSKEGVKANLSEEQLFDGGLRRNQIAQYASEELLEWFTKPGNQRLTETEFVKQWEGRFTVADQDRRNQPLSEFG